MMAKRLKPPDSSRRILVMRYRFIGDTLLTVPFLRHLRQAHPDATIDVLVAPNSGEVLHHCPYVNELIYFDTTRKHRYEYKPGETPRSFWSYASELRRRSYDTAFILKRSFSSALLAWLAGIPQRIGFDTEGRRFLLTRTVPYRKEVHEIECFLDVLRAVDIPTLDTHLEAWWTDAEDRQIEEWLAQAEKNNKGNQHVLFHVTASNPDKEWPLAIWMSWIDWLLTHYPVTLHCVGAASDASAYQPLLESLSPDLRSRVYNRCGQTTLLESLALIRRMALVVGVDSGVLHMASAVGTPTVGLFRPHHVIKWAPQGAAHQVLIDPSPDILKQACINHLKQPISRH